MPEFLQPQRLDTAVDLLREKPALKILAGGTDLIVLMRSRIVCQHLMDVKKIPELRIFAYTDAGLEIGGAVTCNQIIEADFLDPGHTLLQEAAATLGNVLLRHRATLIGNICNASPGGDMLPACLVLDGKLCTVSPRGEREIPLKEFFTGVKQHLLAPDELVVKIVLPRKKGRGIYLKKRRIQGHDLAQVGVAGYWGEDGWLKLAYAAVAPTPVLIDLGKFTSQELATARENIINQAEKTVRPITDIRSSKDYRLAMLRLFTGRIIDAFVRGVEVER